MSTARANTIANLAGTGSPDIVGGELSRARFNLNGTGTIAARDTFNVSSFTDNGTGDYTATFSNAFPAANYSLSGACFDSAGVANRGVIAAPSASGSILVASARFSSIAIGVGNADYDTEMLQFVGDKP